ncbi:MAG: CoA transferase, partial [Dehalococcoidia bacterium]
MPPLPLNGIRILDLTQIWAGPYCTLLLGGLGAEVIKIESVQRPEPLRGTSADRETATPWESSFLYQTFNLNKLGVTLDLMSPTGRELFLDLVGLSDVVIENFTAGVMDRWGLGYQTLRERCPDIIFLSMPGFGSAGPYAAYRALGTTMEAMSGVAWMTGYPGGPPMRCGLNYGDPIAALYGSFALLSALHYRLQTGLGQRLELSQLEGLITLLPEPLLEYVMNGRVVEREGNGDPRLSPHGCYPCRGDD